MQYILHQKTHAKMYTLTKLTYGFGAMNENSSGLVSVELIVQAT